MFNSLSLRGSLSPEKYSGVVKVVVAPNFFLLSLLNTVHHFCTVFLRVRSQFTAYDLETFSAKSTGYL
jgi:hypothetical protein